MFNNHPNGNSLTPTPMPIKYTNQEIINSGRIKMPSEPIETFRYNNIKPENNNLNFIIDEIIKNNTIISIETRDERFIFVYNEDDPESIIQLTNLFKYIQNSENLDFLNDRLSKKLRYFKVPLNVLRVLIKFKQYLKIF
jgi:hypothetical protein